MVISIKGDCLSRPVEVPGSGHLNQEDLSAFPFSLSRREAYRGPTKDHEGIVYLGEPIALVVVSVVLAPLLGIVVGEPELGVVSPEHGALLEGVLYRALMVWAGSFKHVVEEPWASGILVVYGRDEPGLENLLFPLASLLFLGRGRDVEAPGVSSRLFPLESLLGKMAPMAS